MLGWIVLAAFVALCAWATKCAREPLVAKQYESRPATPSELAFLSGLETQKSLGGETRLADAWWAVLHHRGFLVGQDPFKQIQVNPQADLSGLPEEITQAAQMLSGKDTWTPKEIFKSWRPLMQGIDRQILDAGWANNLLLWARQRFWTNAPLVAVPFFAILAIGFFDLPLWSFLIMLVLAVVVRVISPRHELMTAGGKVRLAQARAEHAAALRAPRDPDQLYLVVALAGPAVLLGTPFDLHASPSLARHGGEGGSAGGCGTDVGVVGWSDGSSGSDGSGDGDGDGDGGGSGGGCGGD